MLATRRKRERRDIEQPPKSCGFTLMGRTRRSQEGGASMWCGNRLAHPRVLRRAPAHPRSQYWLRWAHLQDVVGRKEELLAENALLRHQLVVAVRRVKRPQLRPSDRILLVTLAAMVSDWRAALV